ncbi:MAG TPA: EAL domain-containing protein [Methylophilaceae bacterium]|nr:EAL domain-containing protein [Methylophilaceae bacterium]
MEVIAEGIETGAQAQFLQEHGCEIGQGYLYSAPLSKRETEKLLRSGQVLAA